MQDRTYLIGAVLLVTCAAALVRADTVYSNNFDGLRTIVKGVSATEIFVVETDTVQGFAGLGTPGNQFGGKFVRNYMPGNPQNYTELILTNLPKHDSISLGFLLAIIDSWDGLYTDYNTQPGYIPDYFNVTVDGQTVLRASYDNATNDGIHESPAGDPLAVRVQLGFGLETANQLDSAYDLSNWSSLRNIAHTSSTVDIRFFANGAGWEGYTESWAMDNLKVELNSSVVTNLGPAGELPLPGVGLGAGVLLAMTAFLRLNQRGPRSL